MAPDLQHAGLGDGLAAQGVVLVAVDAPHPDAALVHKERPVPQLYLPKADLRTPCGTGFIHTCADGSGVPRISVQLNPNSDVPNSPSCHAQPHMQMPEHMALGVSHVLLRAQMVMCSNSTTSMPMCACLTGLRLDVGPICSSERDDQHVQVGLLCRPQTRQAAGTVCHVVQNLQEKLQAVDTE